MATNYTQASIVIPESWGRQAALDFATIIITIQSATTARTYPDGYEILNQTVTEEYLGGELQVHPDSSGEFVFYSDDECFDVDTITTILRAIAAKYDIPYEDAIHVSWANTCSSMRVGEFSGGELYIYGKTKPLDPLFEGAEKEESRDTTIENYADGAARKLREYVETLRTAGAPIPTVPYNIPDGLRCATFTELAIEVAARALSDPKIYEKLREAGGQHNVYQLRKLREAAAVK